MHSSNKMKVFKGCNCQGCKRAKRTAFGKAVLKRMEKSFRKSGKRLSEDFLIEFKSNGFLS